MKPLLTGTHTVADLEGSTLILFWYLLESLVYAITLTFGSLVTPTFLGITSSYFKDVLQYLNTVRVNVPHNIKAFLVLYFCSLIIVVSQRYVHEARTSSRSSSLMNVTLEA